MGIIEKSRLRGRTGFSLLELMVVVAILGALATIAIPRFTIFRARARQGEAKVNLDVIYKLQEAFRIQHEQYYDGDNAKWGGASMDEADARQGHRGGASTGNRCERNKLGFRMAECSAARYGYYIAGADETEFLAIAYGASDATGDVRVYPGCDGDGADVQVDTADATSIQDPCDSNDDWEDSETAFDSGDAWCMEEHRRLQNYRDIVEYCGAAATPTPSP